MNRAEFVDEIAKQKGISRRQAYRSVNAVMDTLRLVLDSGDRIEIGGFGVFEVLTDLNGQRIPVFRGGRALKRILNAADKQTEQDEQEA